MNECFSMSRVLSWGPWNRDTWRFSSSYMYLPRHWDLVGGKTFVSYQWEYHSKDTEEGFPYYCISVMECPSIGSLIGTNVSLVWVSLRDGEMRFSRCCWEVSPTTSHLDEEGCLWFLWIAAETQLALDIHAFQVNRWTVCGIWNWKTHLRTG